MREKERKTQEDQRREQDKELEREKAALQIEKMMRGLSLAKKKRQKTRVYLILRKNYQIYLKIKESKICLKA